MALCLLSPILFAFLVPVDLLSQTNKPNMYPDALSVQIEALFQKAGKRTLLSTQMTWVVGDIANCDPIETFALATVIPAPSPHFNSTAPANATEAFADVVPQTTEDWCTAQQEGPSFAPFVVDLPAAAVRDGL
jgi:hypothetical protein